VSCVATPFPELNNVLAGLKETAQAILGANFVGAYLQGSLAVGDADEQSDCDSDIWRGRTRFWTS